MNIGKRLDNGSGLENQRMAARTTRAVMAQMPRPEKIQTETNGKSDAGAANENSAAYAVDISARARDRLKEAFAQEQTREAQSFENDSAVRQAAFEREQQQEIEAFEREKEVEESEFKRGQQRAASLFYRDQQIAYARFMTLQENQE